MAKVSIIICTYNRATDLAATLESISGVDLPAQIEVLVVDNGSTDCTSAVVAHFRTDRFVCRYVAEPRRGKCFAYNRGIAESRGEILVFTDDDIRPAHNWLEQLTKPLRAGVAEAVAGAIVIPPRLRRTWMTPLHLSLLASTENWEEPRPAAMNGANMAFKRSVLEKVPAFDPELGPGALGFWDEALFSRQLVAAGFRIVAAPEAIVEHHFHDDRLSRKAFLDRAEKEGRSLAYVAWHWGHDPYDRQVLFRALKKTLKLQLLRILRLNDIRRFEGCATWEIETARSAAYFKQYSVEQRRTRCYAKEGLVKVHSS